MRRIQIALLALLLAAVARAEETTKEAWGIVHMMGKPVGHAHTVVRRTAELVETTVKTKMTIKRMGAEMTVESTEKTVERLDGRLVSMRSTQKMSATEMKSEVTFKDGKAHIVTTTMGAPREITMDCPADAVGVARLEAIGKDLIDQPGAKVEAATFAAELGGALRMTIHVVGEEEIELLGGKKRTLTRIEAVPDKAPIKTVSWMTKDGETLKTQVAIGGLLIEMYATTRERALGAGTEELTPDLFKRMLIVAKHPVPYARRVDSALLEVRAEGSLPEFKASNQVVEASGDGVARVRIRRARPPRGGTRPLEPADAYAGCLEANSMVQSDAPEIQSIAKDVVGDVKDAWRAAQTLERWVHDNLTEKSLGVGFASALEVCRNREGDCTEHSVFLAALCRAAGIPARVAMGFEYIAGTWAGHAWNEVWIDGRWYALDATNGYGSADALHLTLSTMTLRDADMGREFLTIATWMGKLKIDVEEVTYRGRTLRPAAPKAVTVEGDRYVNRLWGLALTKPAGYEFDREQPRGLNVRLLTLRKLAEGKWVEIEISALDAPAEGGWPAIRKMLRWSGWTVTEVDGRPAGRVKGDVAVLAGDAVYLFRTNRLGTDPEKQVFQAFLDSVDFDVDR
jgi:hypothetical protein